MYVYIYIYILKQFLKYIVLLPKLCELFVPDVFPTRLPQLIYIYISNLLDIQGNC